VPNFTPIRFHTTEHWAFFKNVSQEEEEQELEKEKDQLQYGISTKIAVKTFSTDRSPAERNWRIFGWQHFFRL